MSRKFILKYDIRSMFETWKRLRVTRVEVRTLKIKMIDK